MDRSSGGLREHRLFVAALALAAALRLVAMLGYTPALWFSDSFDYVHAALEPYPHPIRPSGYSFLLMLLEPFHSFALVVGVQHLMGLGMGVMLYALLRHRFRLPAWGATLAALPVLFDAYQIQLEHLILSDTPFTFLMVAAITVLLWRDRPTWKMTAAAGTLLALATLTRTIGLAVLLAAGGYLLVRRIGWRPVAALVAACAVPLTLYAGWFYAHHGKVALTQSDGVFLYVRAMSFADCNKFKPPVEEQPLCTATPPKDRPPASQQYLWARLSPLHRVPDERFSAAQNELAGDFARRAIAAQPGDYLGAVAYDFFRVFRWDRPAFPDRATFDLYEFGKAPPDLPRWRTDPAAARDLTRYEHGQARTEVVQPFAGIMRVYQDVFSLRGALLGVILLVGLAGLLAWPARRASALLPWATAVGLLLAPAAAVEFDYRYVLPAVPLACLAVAIAWSPALRLSRRATGAAGTAVPDPRTEPGSLPSPASPTGPRTP